MLNLINFIDFWIYLLYYSEFAASIWLYKGYNYMGSWTVSLQILFLFKFITAIYIFKKN